MKFSAKREGGSSSGGPGKDDYLRLKDGDKVKVLFRGDIIDYHAKWNGQYYEEVPKGTKIKGSDGKEKKAPFRFKVNVIIEENGSYVAKVLEQGWGLYDQMADINDTYPLESYWMRVARKGSGANDTTYGLVPWPEGKVTPEEEAKISKVKLHELKKQEPLEAKEADEIPPPGDDDHFETPFED